MQKYLVDIPQRGDTVVFYDASHGSLRVNSKGNKLTVLVNGKYVHADSTLVPSDAYKGGYDVRDREMTRIFNAALDKGVHLTVIFDSCHSGGISRGVGPGTGSGLWPLIRATLTRRPRLMADGRRVQRPRSGPTIRRWFFPPRNKTRPPRSCRRHNADPHGAFTAALLEALQALPADTPAALGLTTREGRFWRAAVCPIRSPISTPALRAASSRCLEARRQRRVKCAPPLWESC